MIKLTLLLLLFSIQTFAKTHIQEENSKFIQAVNKSFPDGIYDGVSPSNSPCCIKKESFILDGNHYTILQGSVKYPNLEQKAQIVLSEQADLVSPPSEFLTYYTHHTEQYRRFEANIIFNESVERQMVLYTYPDNSVMLMLRQGDVFDQRSPRVLCQFTP